MMNALDIMAREHALSLMGKQRCQDDLQTWAAPAHARFVACCF